MDPMPPEALLEDYPPPMQEIANRLRTVVMDTFPDAIERVRPGWRLIGYDLPSSRPGRRTIYFAFVWAEPEHVHLGFEHGWAMRDPHRILEGVGVTKRVRWLTFRPGDRLHRDRLADYLREAADVAAMTRGERVLRAMDTVDVG
jgi:hypothetical protein